MPRARRNALLFLAGEQKWHFLAEETFLVFSVDIGSSTDYLHHERLAIYVVLPVGVVVVDVAGAPCLRS